MDKWSVGVLEYREESEIKSLIIIPTLQYSITPIVHLNPTGRKS
jgi:hypothetical protein